MFGWAKRSPARSRRFGDYHIVKIVHDGEKAAVFQARSPEQDTLYAIKSYKPLYNRTARRICKRYHVRAEGEVGLLLNAAAGASGEDHPIVRTLRYGWEFDDPGKCYYIVQEFVDGFNVKRLLGSDYGMVVRNRLDTARTIARGLAIIHKRGLVHRDVCTDNILLRKADGRAKLVDLGFVVPEGLSFKEKTGTPSYMSPEQFRVKPLTPLSDVYSFGVVLFELFTGNLPFNSRYPSDKPELLMRRMSELTTKHLKDDPPRPSDIRDDVPEGADAVVLKCLEKSPEDRYQNMREVISALSGLREKEPNAA